jgi:hypothetical protein
LIAPNSKPATIRRAALRVIGNGSQKLRSFAAAVPAIALFFTGCRFYEWERLTFDRLVRGPDGVIIAARLQVKAAPFAICPSTSLAREAL